MTESVYREESWKKLYMKLYKQYQSCAALVILILFLFFWQILLSEARVLALGPKFMSVYIPKIAVSFQSIHIWIW